MMNWKLIAVPFLFITSVVQASGLPSHRYRVYVDFSYSTGFKEDEIDIQNFPVDVMIGSGGYGCFLEAGNTTLPCELQQLFYFTAISLDRESITGLMNSILESGNYDSVDFASHRIISQLVVVSGLAPSPTFGEILIEEKSGSRPGFGIGTYSLFFHD